jgi:glycogen debranching enzyme
MNLIRRASHPEIAGAVSAQQGLVRALDFADIQDDELRFLVQKIHQDFAQKIPDAVHARLQRDKRTQQIIFVARVWGDGIEVYNHAARKGILIKRNGNLTIYGDRPVHTFNIPDNHCVHVYAGMKKVPGYRADVRNSEHSNYDLEAGSEHSWLYSGFRWHHRKAFWQDHTFHPAERGEFENKLKQTLIHLALTIPKRSISEYEYRNNPNIFEKQHRENLRLVNQHNDAFMKALADMPMTPPSVFGRLGRWFRREKLSAPAPLSFP